MTSPNDPKPAKKRAGRKRLPPLPPGDDVQFVVATHPDHFKTADTMRNIRSHVMYKHRGEHRGPSPGDRTKSRERSRSAMGMAQTPSPMATDTFSDSNFLAPPRRRSTVWDGEIYKLLSQSPQMDPLRNLCARIISATTSDPPQGGPSTYLQGTEFSFPNTNSLGQEDLKDLKDLYLDSESGQGECQTYRKPQQTLTKTDRNWMETVCSNRMSFLSHVSVTCVFQDIAEGLLDDSALTVYAKTKLFRMIKDSLQGFGAQSDDFTILSILYLLFSEIGGYDEDHFNVHYQALVGMIHQRGGLNNLGHGNIATFLIV